MIVLDANFLLFLLHENLPAPEDPRTKKPVTECKERIEFLLSQLNKSKMQVVIPTPVLAEVLVRAGSAAAGWVEKISKSPAFRIADFDTRAAVEVSCMAANDLKSKKTKKPRNLKRHALMRRHMQN